MGLLYLMVLSLAVLLLAENNFPPAAVDEAQLEILAPQILNLYRPTYMFNNSKISPMFSLIMRIPFNSKTKTYDISQVTDNANEVKKTIIDCEVFNGTKIMAATVLLWPNVSYQCPNGSVQWPMPKGSHARTWAQAYNITPWPFHEGRAVHAEYRTLKNLKTWLNNQSIGQELLLIFVYASPCATRCANSTHNATILQFLEDYKNFNVSFVFSKVFKPRKNEPVPAEKLQDALMSLGNVIGLDRIFRCDKLHGIMKCVNCNSTGNVTGWCYDDKLPPGKKRQGLNSRWGSHDLLHEL